MSQNSNFIILSAPTPLLKEALAEALLKLAAVSPVQVIGLLEKWLPTFKVNELTKLHSTLDAKLTFIKQKNKC